MHASSTTSVGYERCDTFDSPEEKVCSNSGNYSRQPALATRDIQNLVQAVPARIQESTRLCSDLSVGICCTASRRPVSAAPVSVDCRTHTHTNARTHTRTNTRTNTRTHARTHTHTLTHTHAHTRTHTHTVGCVCCRAATRRGVQISPVRQCQLRCLRAHSLEQALSDIRDSFLRLDRFLFET